jgi:hypothetical protein
VEIVLEPPERKLPGGELLEKIDDEVSEHFEYRPASIVRVRVVRPKYRRPTSAPGQSPIANSELPERPIPRSVAGPGLIAHVIAATLFLPRESCTRGLTRDSLFRRPKVEAGAGNPHAGLCPAAARKSRPYRDCGGPESKRRRAVPTAIQQCGVVVCGAVAD